MLNIRKLREERGLTQKDLVEMTGLAQGTIGAYEKKYKTMKKFIKIGNIEKIAKDTDNVKVSNEFGRNLMQ